MEKKRVNLCGVWIDKTDISGATNAAEGFLCGDECRIIFTPNLEMLAGAYKSEEIRHLLNAADLCLPDGNGVNLIYRLSSPCPTPRLEIVPGIDFGYELLKIASCKNCGVFLLGGKPKVADLAAKNLKIQISGLGICGTRHGYFDAEDYDNIIDEINASGAQILLICTGFPRQEAFALKCKKRLKYVKIIACLGGSLDVWSGRVKRAPRFVQSLKLEWLWRIVKEPFRIKRFAKSAQVIPKMYFSRFRRI